MKQKEDTKEIAKRGKYIDCWSITHFFWGVAFAAFFKFIKQDFKIGLLISVLAFIGWEFIEPSIHKKIIKVPFPEKITNQITDVFVNIIGFLIYWFIF